jgi:2-haloalkanoic acid dehalogenase type II
VYICELHVSQTLNVPELLSFDVYGTLIDWERGAIAALQPAIHASNNPNLNLDRKHILEICHSLEAPEQAKNPGKKYSDSLATIHPELCKQLGLKEPTAEESKAFGASIGDWPAFPDSVAALKRLKKYFKLVVLSNVDNESFKKGNAGGLEGFEFDAVYTAQDIGSYKPDLKNFEYMLKHVKEEFGVEKEQVLQTAQSQFHDHHPAREMGIKSAWIFRPGAIMGNREGMFRGTGDVDVDEMKADSV